MITILSPFPAVLVKSQGLRTVAVADLHIGWELALSKEGIYVPSQTPRLSKRLTEVVSKYRADRLLILGDVKHTVATARTPEWRDVPEFFTNLRKREIEILLVRGNHDGNIEALLPENAEVLPSTGVVVGDVGFFHGHRWPSPTLLGCKTLVMGHVHPVVFFRDPAGLKLTRQVWVKTDCNGVLLGSILQRKYRKVGETEKARTAETDPRLVVRSSKLLIMPSFNDLLGGRPLNERTDGLGSGRVSGPVLRSEAINLKNAETYLLDGTFLGTLEQLRTMS